MKDLTFELSMFAAFLSTLMLVFVYAGTRRISTALFLVFAVSLIIGAWEKLPVSFTVDIEAWGYMLLPVFIISAAIASISIIDYNKFKEKNIAAAEENQVHGDELD